MSCRECGGRPPPPDDWCYHCATACAKQRDVLKRWLRWWLRHNRSVCEMNRGKPSKYCIVVRESAVRAALAGREPPKVKR